jgi:hypothetical protein
MALLDIHNIINPLPNKYNNILDNIDNILENFIINNNLIHNSFIFNHILYTQKDIDSVKEKIHESIKKHLASNIKNQRIYFRELNKKNKLTIQDFNIYFDSIYKLLSKLNGMFQHIISNNFTDNHKWGTSIITITGIQCISTILCEDIIFKSSILKYIQSKITSPDMYKLNTYMSIFAQYNNNNWFENIFVESVDEALVKNIPLISSSDIEVEEYIIDVHNFSIINNYYNESYKTFYYITKTYEFKKINKEITYILQKILSNNNIEFIKDFLITYKKELKHIFKSRSQYVIMILVSFKPVDFDVFISYYLTLCSIVDEETEKMIMLYTEEKVNSLFGSEELEELVNIINNNILHNNTLYNIENDLYYKLGKCFKNQDKFMSLLCLKFMERCIYTNMDISVEQIEFDVIKKYITDKQLYHYTKLIKDFTVSYYNYCNNQTKFIVTSNELWNFNYSVGYTNKIVNSKEFTTLICNIISKYNINTNEVQSTHNKKLILYPHIGYVEIDILNSELIVLPAHMIILEQFENEDININYNELINIAKNSLTNYSDEYINKLFNSMFYSKIIIKDGLNIKINKDFLNQKNCINLINIMHINNISIKIKQHIEAVLAHDRINIIQTNINHFIKIRDYNKDELFDTVYNNINVFELTKEQYNSALEYLIKYDYIIIKDNIVQKLVY